MKDHLYQDLVESCKEVNDVLGSGLRENAYQEALKVALTDKAVQFTEEATIPVLFRGFPVARLHPDLIVGDDSRCIVELKVDRDGSAQAAQYLDHAHTVGLEDIGGAVAVSFGSDLEIQEVDES